jgi:hypothetical protein
MALWTGLIWLRIGQSASRAVVNEDMSLRRLKLSMYEVITPREEERSGSGWGQVAGNCVCGDEPAGPIKLLDSQLLKKDSVHGGSRL